MDYPFELRIVTSRTEADILISARPQVQECADESVEGVRSFGFCAPRYDRGDSAPSYDTITIAGQFNDTVTRGYYRGALAQLLGVDDSETVPGVTIVDAPELRDPWPKPGPVVVGISNTGNTSRDFAPLVRNAIEYWTTGKGSEHANYSEQFVVRPEADSPDVAVKFVSSLIQCGNEYSIDRQYSGCAPIYSGGSAAREQSEILVEVGYTNNSTLSTLTHEFGHLFGRLHGQKPMPVMSATFDATKLPMTDAVNRSRPWKPDSLSIYIDLSTVGDIDRDEWESEIATAIKYVDSGADGRVPEEFDYHVVHNGSEADIILKAREQGSNDNASSGIVWGVSEDADDALEYYTSQRISIWEDVRNENVAWHTAYWLLSPWVGSGSYPQAFDGENDDRANWER
ncbi:MAG: hypothetical protein ABEI31_08610 [Halodesulfurarchaeum sp.]